MNTDYSDLIRKIRQHIDGGHQDFPSYTQGLINIAQKAIAENKASPEQQAELVALEKKLAELPLFGGSMP